MTDEEIKQEYEYIHKLTSEQKLNWWGEGEWIEEADEVRFEYLGFKCRIHRNYAYENEKLETMSGGNLCGYICIPKDNENYDKPYQTTNIDVHGGLTYGNIEENDEYWIGFDCGHSNDITPSMEKLYATNIDLIEIRKKYPTLPFSHMWEKTYKNIAYCIGECKSMAEQLLKPKEIQKDA